MKYNYSNNIGYSQKDKDNIIININEKIKLSYDEYKSDIFINDKSIDKYNDYIEELKQQLIKAKNIKVNDNKYKHINTDHLELLYKYSRVEGEILHTDFNIIVKQLKRSNPYIKSLINYLLKNKSLTDKQLKTLV